MEENTLKKALSQLVILSAVGISALFSPAFTAEASYEEGIQETTRKLNKLETEQRNAQAQLASLSADIASTEEESKKLVGEIEQTTEQLENLEKEIEALNKAIDAREEKLKQQARSVQTGGEASNILQFIIEADSFLDVLGRVDAVSQLLGANKELVQQQRNDKEAVVVKENETKEKQESQMKLAAELEAKKAVLEQKQVEKEVLVASISAEKAQVQSERAQFVAQKADAQRRVREMEAARVVASQTSAQTGSSNASTTSNRTENKKPTVNVAPAPSVSGGSIISNAYAVSGTRYSYGGTTTSGFDCSGFTSYAYSKAGKSLPRTAGGQYASSTRISLSQAKPGDLIFFNQTGTIDHVGIYLGNGKFIGSQTSTGVAVASFTSGYWARHVVGFGRR